MTAYSSTDPLHLPQKQVDTHAREILNQFPTAQLCVAQALKDYSAKVSITAKEPAAAPEPEAPAA